MDKLVVVLTRNYSTALSVVRALGSAGYTIDLIITTRGKDVEQSKVATCSKYVREATVLTGKKNSEITDKKIIDRIKKYIGTRRDKIILFPTDDYSAMLIDQYREELSGYFIMPYIVGGKSQELTRLMDKAVQGAIARSVGMKAPKEWVFRLDNFAIPEDMVYPCFVKPLQSISGYKTEMKKCDDKHELAMHLAMLKSRNEDRSILVQEFLNIDTEISMSGVCIDQEIILPALVSKSRVAKYEKGVTLSGSLVPVNTVGEETERLIYEVLKKFHYVGQFDMEILVVGNEYYFGEVNLRSGGPNFAYTLNGVNLPEIAVRALLGLPRIPEKEEGIRYHKPFIYEKVAWEDYLNFCMTKKELNAALEECPDRLLDWAEDPAPGKFFKEMMEANEKKERLRAVLKKTPFYTAYTWRSQNKTYRSSYENFMKVKKEISADAILAGGAQRENKKMRVIVMSRNYSSLLTMVRSLACKHYDVEVIRLCQSAPKFYRVYSRMNPEGYSKYLSGYHILVTNHDPMTLVNKLISMYDPDRPTLLIPADDLPTSIIDEYYDELKDYYLMPNAAGKAGRANMLMDKTNQKQMMTKFGFNTTQCHEIVISNNRYEIPEGIKYPAFLKPTVSVTSSKKIMQKIESEEHLIQVMDDLSGSHRDLSVLVEDYIEIEHEYALLGMCAGDKVVIPNAILELVESGHAGRRGVAMIGQVLSTEPMNDLMEQIRAFLKPLNFTGLFDIDLLEAGGKIYVCEMNLRFGASGYAITSSGVNLPRMFADYMLMGKAVKEYPTVDRVGRRFVSEKVLLEDHGEHYISTAKVRKTMRDCEIHFIYSTKDPEPYNYFKKFYKYAFVMPLYTAAKKVKSIIKPQKKGKGRRRRTTETPVLAKTIQMQNQAAQSGMIVNDSEEAAKAVEAARAEFMKSLASDDVVAKEQAAGKLLFETANLMRVEGINAEDALTYMGRSFETHVLNAEIPVAETEEG